MAVQNRLDRIGGGLPLKRSFARKHFVDDRAYRKDVGPLVNGESAHLFRRHVSDRAHHHPGGRISCQGSCVGRGGLRIDQLGQAEVENLQVAIFREE